MQNLLWSSAGAGNYFHSRAISGFIMCLAGQIQVKYFMHAFFVQ